MNERIFIAPKNKWPLAQTEALKKNFVIHSPVLIERMILEVVAAVVVGVVEVVSYSLTAVVQHCHLELYEKKAEFVRNLSPTCYQ